MRYAVSLRPGGFMPFGWHGVFEALPLGVVFALQGFEQAVCLAGEARNPRKDLSRAILTAMGIGATTAPGTPWRSPSGRPGWR